MKIAFPTTTTGWRARCERRLGEGTLSGSSAARGLRGKGGFAAEEAPSGGRFEFTQAAPESIPMSLFIASFIVAAEKHPRSCTLEKIMRKLGVLAGTLLSIVTAKNQRRVCPPESERIRQCRVDITFACLVGDQVDRRVDRRIIEIDRGRRNLITNGKD